MLARARRVGRHEIRGGPLEWHDAVMASVGFSKVLGGQRRFEWRSDVLSLQGNALRLDVKAYR